VSRTTDAVEVKALPARDPMTGEDESLWLTNDRGVIQAAFNWNIVEDKHILD
jgi:hypothetical protein